MCASLIVPPVHGNDYTKAYACGNTSTPTHMMALGFSALHVTLLALFVLHGLLPAASEEVLQIRPTLPQDSTGSLLLPSEVETQEITGHVERHREVSESTKPVATSGDKPRSKHVCHVSDFGAAGNGETFDTIAIQSAIDSCAAVNGIVHFSPGSYLTATVFLKSNITLQIDHGATILGSPYQQDYPTQSTRWYVILAENAENVEVMGGGTVDGQGHKFVTRFDEKKNRMVSWNTTGDCLGDECRPRLIGFLNCTHVHIWDVYLHEPAYWCLHIIDSNDVLIEDVRIYGDFNSPNNDGIDIESSNNTVITGCHIDTGDDAICPKTSVDGPLFNLTVSDCWIRTKSSAVKLGSASFSDFHGLRFERLKIVDSHRGLAIQLRDSGRISDVTFANIEMSTCYYDPSWWGRAEPIYVTACPRDAATVVGSVTGVHFINISATSENGIFLAGTTHGILSNIIFQNVSMDYKSSEPSIPTYHDYRPGCQGLVAHSSSGLFIEYATNLSFTDVNIHWDPDISWNLPFEFTPMTVGNFSLNGFSSSTSFQASIGL